METSFFFHWKAKPNFTWTESCLFDLVRPTVFYRCRISIEEKKKKNWGVLKHHEYQKIFVFQKSSVLVIDKFCATNRVMLYVVVNCRKLLSKTFHRKFLSKYFWLKIVRVLVNCDKYSNRWSNWLLVQRPSFTTPLMLCVLI